MNHNLFRRLVICLEIAFFIIAFNGHVFGGSISIKWGKGSESDNASVAKKHKKQGPPAHAPAHGYRAKHQVPVLSIPVGLLRYRQRSLFLSER